MASGIDILRLEQLPGPSIRSLMVVDGAGDRTIVGLTEDRLSEVAVPVDELEPGDVVAFPSWRAHFAPALAVAQQKGCRTVVDLRALSDPGCRADLAVGSRHELGEALTLHHHFEGFPNIVVTDGTRGAEAYTPVGRLRVDALPVRSVNATGAGDAFFAGYVADWVKGRDARECLRRVARWGAGAVTRQESVPAPWPDVEEVFASAKGFLPRGDCAASSGFVSGQG